MDWNCSESLSLGFRCGRTQRAGTLFSYDADGIDGSRILDALVAGASGSSKRVLDFLSLGESNFARFHELTLGDGPRQIYNAWHAYDLPRLAPGYFIGNVIESVCPDSVYRFSDLWFPRTGKEPYMTGEKAFLKPELLMD